ncbi:small subunit ribosomal protein S25e [Nematocida minor]|uniref:small subunit ribosomal protein S25e n=1 Tax=Nematocida minor TaxID=1912983 RepID=UPI002220CB07|nr:small subunit ribosomal protein S25e [Nematocida minor]KAI5189895.1 small subunit ribosomal protein S25e [Nematocida minor]
MAAKKVDPKAQQKKGGKDKPAKKVDTKKWTKTASKDKQIKASVITEDIFNKIKKEVLGMSLITPATISARHNLETAVAKNILEEIVKTGEIEVIAKSSFGRVYGKKETKEVKEIKEETVAA